MHRICMNQPSPDYNTQAQLYQIPRNAGPPNVAEVPIIFLEMKNKLLACKLVQLWHVCFHMADFEEICVRSYHLASIYVLSIFTVI